jgi:hypothetical protein
MLATVSSRLLNGEAAALAVLATRIGWLREELATNMPKLTVRSLVITTTKTERMSR